MGTNGSQICLNSSSATLMGYNEVLLSLLSHTVSVMLPGCNGVKEYGFLLNHKGDSLFLSFKTWFGIEMAL